MATSVGVLLVVSSVVCGAAGVATSARRSIIREHPSLASVGVSSDGAVLSLVQDSHAADESPEDESPEKALAVSASGAASLVASSGAQPGRNRTAEREARKAARTAARKAARAANRTARKAVKAGAAAAAPTPECAKPHDFVVGIDASNSIGNESWPVQVSFANSVIAELLGMGVGHRVATYYFGGNATMVSDFSDDAAALSSGLSALTYEDVKFGATNHPAGFFLSEELFSGSPLAASAKLHLLITDGQSWKSCTHLTEEQVKALPCTPTCQNKMGTCDYLSEKGKPVGEYCKCAMHTAESFNSKYTTYTVGVLNKNGRSGEEKLMGLASSPAFYMPATFEDLPSVLKNVTLGVCQDPPTPPPPPTPECAKPHDFVVGIDASKSIGTKHWPVEVAFANSVIGELLGMGVGHRVATYYFAGEATMVSDFSDDFVAVESALSALTYEDVVFGATNHPAGFMLSEKLFGGSPLADSAKLHLLITDGQSWKSCKHLTDEQVKALPCTPACQNKTGSCDYFSAKGKPSGAYCKCAMHTADAFNSKYATYTVGVLNKNGRSGEEKLMGLASSPGFYMPATFEDLPAVLKNVTQGLCEDPGTTTTTTTTTTEATDCNAVGQDQHLRLDRASVTENNLGGRGPTFTDPEHIRYADVATLADGTVVDLVVSSRGDYKPFEGVLLNGMSVHGPIGIIGMEASVGGNKVDLDFSFVDHTTGLAVELPALDFSIMDFDTGSSSAEESVTISGFDGFYVPELTEVKVSTAPDGRATFTATHSGHHEDNPADPLHLTHEQAQRTVNFAFTSVSKISMTLSVSKSLTDHVYGRDFLFAGKTAVKDCGQLRKLPKP